MGEGKEPTLLAMLSQLGCETGESEAEHCGLEVVVGWGKQVQIKWQCVHVR